MVCSLKWSSRGGRENYEGRGWTHRCRWCSVEGKDALVCQVGVSPGKQAQAIFSHKTLWQLLLILQSSPISACSLPLAPAISINLTTHIHKETIRGMEGEREIFIWQGCQLQRCRSHWWCLQELNQPLHPQISTLFPPPLESLFSTSPSFSFFLSFWLGEATDSKYDILGTILNSWGNQSCMNI